MANNYTKGNTITLYGRVGNTELETLFDDYAIRSCTTSLPSNGEIVSLSSSSVAGISELNGTYTDDYGMGELIFRGSHATVKALGITIASGSYSIDSGKLIITDNRGEVQGSWSFQRNDNDDSLIINNTKYRKK